MNSELPWFADGRFPLYLAPMAGFTDVAFRQICKEYGADVMVTEFVMANKFLDERSEEDAWEIVDFSEEQRPMGVQIFGSEPEKMAEAAKRIVERLRPDFIDINFGCPAQKVVDNCAGSSLLKDLPLMQGVTQAVVDAVCGAVPVTAKMRTGWDAQTIVAVDAARCLEDAGVAAIAVHGRTKEQGYSGDADWDVIHQVADAVRVPVIGNGSVRTAEDVLRIQRIGKVRGLMIGRAALGYPWIFRQIKECLNTGVMPPQPEIQERWEVILRYTRALSSRPGRKKNRWETLNWMRPRIQAFTKVMPGGKKIRAELARIRTMDELEELANQHLAELAAATLGNVC